VDPSQPEHPRCAQLRQKLASCRPNSPAPAGNVGGVPIPGLQRVQIAATWVDLRALIIAERYPPSSFFIHLLSLWLVEDVAQLPGAATKRRLSACVRCQIFINHVPTRHRCALGCGFAGISRVLMFFGEYCLLCLSRSRHRLDMVWPGWLLGRQQGNNICNLSSGRHPGCLAHNCAIWITGGGHGAEATSGSGGCQGDRDGDRVPVQNIVKFRAKPTVERWTAPAPALDRRFYPLLFFVGTTTFTP